MTSISITEAPVLIRQFFTWWGRELMSLIPKKLIDRIQTSSKDYILHVGPKEMSLTPQKDSTDRHVLEFGTETEPSQKQKLQALQLFQKLKVGVVRECWIDDGHILQKRIELPKTAQGSNLPLIIQNQIQKLTPFSLDEVLFDFCQIDSQTDGKDLVCEIAIVHKKHVARYLHLLSTLGLQPRTLRHRSVIRGEEKGFSFSLSKGKAPSHSLVSGLKAALLIFLIGSLITISALPLYRQNAKIQQLEARVQSNKENAQIAARMVSDISKISEDYNFIVQKKASTPSKLEILNELSTILPDDTWVFSLIEGKDKIELQGYSGNTSEIIPLIESSPYFTEVNLSSGIVRNTQSAKERFHLNFKIDARGMP